MPSSYSEQIDVLFNSVRDCFNHELDDLVKAYRLRTFDGARHYIEATNSPDEALRILHRRHEDREAFTSTHAQGSVLRRTQLFQARKETIRLASMLGGDFDSIRDFFGNLDHWFNQMQPSNLRTEDSLATISFEVRPAWQEIADWEDRMKGWAVSVAPSVEQFEENTPLQPTKPRAKKKLRGRPSTTDREKDKKLFEDWTASGLTLREFCCGRAIDLKETDKAIKRHRGRLNDNSQ